MFCEVSLRSACEHPQVVQTAGGEHDFIHKAGSPVAKEIRHDVATFEASDGVFHRHPHAADDLVDGFLDGMEFTPPWLFLRLEGLGAGRLVALEASVFDDQGIRRVGQPTFIGELFVVNAAGRGGSQVNDPLLAGEQQVLFAVGFFLAAVVFLLVVLVLGPTHGPLHPIEDQKPQFGHFFQEGIQISGAAGR